MGFVPIPCGCIIFKEEVTLDFIETLTPYLSQKRQHTLLGTRTGASAASAFAVFKLLGREGYREIVRKCMENTLRLYKGVSELGFIVRKPTMNILVFRGEERTRGDLKKRGWQLSKTRDGEIRIIVMPHVTEAIVDEFLLDLRAVSGG
jgi:tyrosine decarboxylase/aspartate 1-decarboxylase